jgi:hypothetical protein
MSYVEIKTDRTECMSKFMAWAVYNAMTHWQSHSYSNDD